MWYDTKGSNFLNYFWRAIIGPLFMKCPWESFFTIKFPKITAHVHFWRVYKIQVRRYSCSCSGCLSGVDCLANDGYNSWSTVEMTLKPVLEPVIELILNDFYIINFVFLDICIINFVTSFNIVIMGRAKVTIFNCEWNILKYLPR